MTNSFFNRECKNLVLPNCPLCFPRACDMMANNNSKGAEWYNFSRFAVVFLLYDWF